MAVKDLTSGKPFKLILLFSLPIFLGNMFQQFYNLIDALIVGRTLGVGALASIGATTPLIFFTISFIFASTQGFSVVTAQSFGAGDYQKVRKSVCTSFVLSFALTVVLTLLTAPFSYQMLKVLRTPLDVIDGANSYLFIMLAGIFATVFYNVSSNIIRALGDSKTPLYFLIFASLLNIALDLIFILKFQFGIVGAALATVLSQGVSTVLCLSFMFLKFPILKLKKSDWNFNKELYIEHLRIGLPMGFQMSVLSLGVIAMQYVLNSFGSNAIAAFTTAMRVDQAFCNAYLALGSSAAVFSAQNFGAKKIARIRQGASASVLLAASISIVTIIVLSLFSAQLISLFMDEPNQEVISLAVEYLHIIMFFFFFLGLLLIFRNILQGMGNVLVPLLSGTVELVARVFGAFVLAHYFNYTGICFATPMAWLFGAIVLYLCYRISLKKNIKKMRVLKI